MCVGCKKHAFSFRTTPAWGEEMQSSVTTKTGEPIWEQWKVNCNKNITNMSKEKILDYVLAKGNISFDIVDSLQPFRNAQGLSHLPHL